MRKCHYTYDIETGMKIHIPGCYAGIYDPGACCCYRGPTTAEGFEREDFNEKMKEKNEQIKALEQYNAQLQRTIKKLIKKNSIRPVRIKYVPIDVGRPVMPFASEPEPSETPPEAPIAA